MFGIKKLFRKWKRIPLYDVTLLDRGDKPLSHVQVVSQFTGLELKDARNLVDRCPTVVLQSCTAEVLHDFCKEVARLGGSTSTRRVGYE